MVKLSSFMVLDSQSNMTFLYEKLDMLKQKLLEWPCGLCLMLKDQAFNEYVLAKGLTMSSCKYWHGLLKYGKCLKSNLDIA